MPYIYCCILLLLLFIYSCFLTWQLYRLIEFEFSIQKKYLKKLGSYSINELFYVLRSLSRKKMWLSALRVAESQNNIPLKKHHYYFNVLGVIYQQMQEYHLAELYYLMSLQKNESYYVALNNLSKLKNRIELM